MPDDRYNRIPRPTIKERLPLHLRGHLGKDERARTLLRTVNLEDGVLQLLVERGMAELPQHASRDAASPDTGVMPCPLHQPGKGEPHSVPCVSTSHLLLHCTCTAWERLRLRLALREALRQLQGHRRPQDLRAVLRNCISRVVARREAAQTHRVSGVAAAGEGWVGGGAAEDCKSEEADTDGVVEDYKSEDMDDAGGDTSTTGSSGSSSLSSAAASPDLDWHDWVVLEQWCTSDGALRLEDPTPSALLHVVLMSDTLSAALLEGKRKVRREFRGAWVGFTRTVLHLGRKYARECLRVGRRRLAAAHAGRVGAGRGGLGVGRGTRGGSGRQCGPAQEARGRRGRAPEPQGRPLGARRMRGRAESASAQPVRGWGARGRGAREGSLPGQAVRGGDARREVRGGDARGVGERLGPPPVQVAGGLGARGVGGRHGPVPAQAVCGRVLGARRED